MSVERRRDFSLSPRPYGDRDWFGLIANPSGTINVPAPEPQDTPEQYFPWPDPAGDPGEAPAGEPAEPQHAAGAAGIPGPAAGTALTVVGNLTADPRLRSDASGSAVAVFTIASTARAFDPASRQWRDGETLFVRARIRGEAAGHAVESLARGTRVIATGFLRPASGQDGDGQDRAGAVLEVRELAVSLRWATATLSRTRPADGNIPPGRTGTGGAVPGSVP